MEDWDLQAVVKGYTNAEASFVNEPSCFSPLNIQYENLDFATFFGTPGSTTILDEFGDFHKFFSHAILSPTSMSVPEERNQQAGKFQELQQGCVAAVGSPVASSTAAASPRPPRPKKRKSNEKRVVEELTAERLKMDIWAWRKYGQKPIKGSPYPRSYYRCSSSKGCPARRQVEQSYTNPGMFIVTYTAEHNHAKPTKRSSLAGTTRKKSNYNIYKEEEEQVITNKRNTIYSSRAVEEEEVINGGEYCESSSNNIAIPDVIFSENLFPAFEEMAGISSEWTFEFDS